jgi:probable HAF family extracellular repeat protein
MLCRIRAALAIISWAAGLALNPVSVDAQSNLLTDLGAGSGFGINNNGQIVLSSGTYSSGILTPFPTGFAGDAINSTGEVVGLFRNPPAILDEAAIYSNGTVTTIGVPLDPSVGASYATGINTSGQIVGWSSILSGATDAFIYSNGTITNIGVLPGSVNTGFASGANGINDAGQVTGTTLDTLPSPVAQYAFIYDSGTWTLIGFGDGFAINAKGQVTGILSSTPTTGVIFPFSPTNEVLGTPVGHAFIYSNGTTTDLGTLPGGTTSFGFAINSTGQIVGASDGTGYSGQHAFFYNGGITDMNALVSATDPLQPFVTLTDSHGINDSRLIVVNGIDSRTQLQHAYLLQGPWLDVAPGPLSFPSQALGTVSSAQSVSLTNAGPTPLTVGLISTTGDFKLANNGCVTPLAPSGGCSVSVTFGPTAAGDRSGALTVISAGVPITVPLSGVAPIQVNISSSAAKATAGVPVNLTWTVSPGASCTATGGSAADGWTGAILASGTKSVTETTAGTYPYGLSCTAGSQSQSSQTSVVVAWPLVSVSLTASPASFTAGQSATLKWSSANATSCTATGGGAGDTWPGAKATAGTATLTEPYAPAATSLTLTFTLKCTSSVSGLSASASAKAVENAVPAAPAAKSGGGALDPIYLLFLTGVAVLGRLRHGRSAE